MTNSMVASHAKWPAKADAIFAIAGKAQEAIKKHGKENVTNSTLGALMDDNGKLIAFDSVFGTLKAMPNEKISAYAPIAGMPQYLEASVETLFAGYKPDAHIRAVATPGGSGALKIAMWNYTDLGDEILTSDWYWSPYKTISEEAGRHIKTFKLFTEDGHFNVADFKEKFKEILNRQDRIMAILNTPAQNPTGYSISDDEWDEILAFVKEEAKNPEKKIVLLVDTAYIDFAGEKDEKRAFFSKFSNLPNNIFTMVAYSTSKGYTMYGLRLGAIIGISSNEEIADEFNIAALHSGRANWSNGNRGAMLVVSEIYNNKDLLAQYTTEKDEWKGILRRRAEAFVEAAKEVDLELLPYRDGFFVSLPCDNPYEISDALTEKNIFMVPLAKGVRFAVCAVSEEKCRKAPKVIKEVMDQLK
ncbi:aminotransferase class I/II-fold pyridoxal phosphate-dependent enzyme [Acidaminobacter sp. JC074]|uniref:pyridoxal phosphate-dependent aminotransferase n=1 Tax=Acidaminobacter sp. JC074 TaxID=2530199 RepID=UPI001F0F7918|nr:aminotransferase class I/II-fold pyridoxal phosphate-dependent enzyme [Acidaminobacter sp. JC074]MCH4886376.1 aminotransferase class I/II-fold pyridoxal phosphate-dependent enzyme [Acidaminobacter sp. JC074]